MEHDHELEEKYEGLLPDAIIFAFNAHSGQYRKMSPEQYIIHPLRVSEFLLKNFPEHPSIKTMRIAAILHDTIEDTWATEKNIEQQFGKKIATIVAELTKPEIEDKEERHNQYLKIIQNACDESKIIKLADIFDNVFSIDNSSKWKIFLTNSRETLMSSDLKKRDKTYENIKTEVINIINEKLKHYD